MESKITKNITCIFPNKLGGVAILMKNLIDYFPDKNYRFNFVFTEIKEENYSYCDNLFGNVDKKKFTFSKYENRFYVHKKLSKIIPQNTDIIIANDWIELEAYATQKLSQKLIFILHGDYDYYYNLATKYSSIIDYFVTVSSEISSKLNKKLPSRKNDINYLKNIIANPSQKVKIEPKDKYNAIFVGRLTEAKGFFDLEKIDSLLKTKNIYLNWTIIGPKKENFDENNSWIANENVKWLGALDNVSVLNEYHKNDFFILPTRAEGLGMVIIEAMKSGCIPLVSKLEAGIPEFIENDKTGYMIEIGNIQKYADLIVQLTQNIAKRKELSKNAISKANLLFSPKKDAEKYLNLFEYLLNKNSTEKKYPKISFSRLDNKFIPNFLVKTIRFAIKHPKL